MTASVAADEEMRKEFTAGYSLDEVSVETQKDAPTKVDYVVSDTRMQIRLPQPLRGGGGSIRVHIRYHYTIPGLFGGRTSWTTTKNGEIYDIAQWYPRMAVYDDLHGWDTLALHGAGVLSRVRQFRLLRHRAVGHVGGGQRRAAESRSRC